MMIVDSFRILSAVTSDCPVDISCLIDAIRTVLALFSKLESFHDLSMGHKTIVRSSKAPLESLNIGGSFRIVLKCLGPDAIFGWVRYDVQIDWGRSPEPLSPLINNSVNRLFANQ
jgi:hypothetical protein